MNNLEPSPWAPPPESAPKTPEDHLAERYIDRNNPDDADGMVNLPSERQSATPEIPSPLDRFKVGSEVTIMRSPNKQTGAPAYEDGGWEIIDADIDIDVGEGKTISGVLVEKEINGKWATKEVSLTTLNKLNPEAVVTPEVAEKLPFSEKQAELADEAIEEAIGLEDPSDIGEAREAASRVMDEEIVGPDPLATEKAEFARQAEAMDAELHAMVEAISQADKLLMWRYAASGDDYAQRGRAKDKLSYKFTEKNPGLLEDYASKFKHLRELRVKAGILDK